MACRRGNSARSVGIAGVLSLLFLVLGQAESVSRELERDRSPRAFLRGLVLRGDGRIGSARVVQETPAGLDLRIGYKIPSGEGLSISVVALDRRYRSLDAVREHSAPLEAGEGEAAARLELSRALGPDDVLRQEFLEVRIGPRRGRPIAFETFECRKEWRAGEGLAGTGEPASGGTITVPAQPIGRSTRLADARAVFGPVGMPVGPITLPEQGPDRLTKQAGPVVRLVKPGEAGLTLPRGGAARPAPRPGIRDTVRPLGERPVKVLPPFVVGVPEPEVNRGAKGPGRSGFWLSEIASDVNLGPGEILSLYGQIFQDANPRSGYFYYLPRAFHLDWDENGYALDITYGASAPAGDPPGAGAPQNTVHFTARLNPGIDTRELEMAAKLAEFYFKSQYPQDSFRGLRPFPVSGVVPSISAEAYGLSRDRFTLTRTTDLAVDMTLSFATDPVTAETLRAVLTQGAGIHGTLTVRSASDRGEGALEADLPLSIALADRGSFGPLFFRRGTPVENRTPYPMRLKHLHYLMPGATGTIYSFSLSDAVVPPRGKAQIDAGKAPAYLDQRALKTWVEYSLVGDEATHREIVKRSIDGSFDVVQSAVTFRTLTPLADTGAALILVTVSTRYLDPKGREEKTVTLELNKDNAAFELKPVFLLNRKPEEDRPDDPLIRYRLTVVLPDGTTKEGKEWVATSKMTLFIGSAHVKPILQAAGGQ